MCRQHPSFSPILIASIAIAVWASSEVSQAAILPASADAVVLRPPPSPSLAVSTTDTQSELTQLIRLADEALISPGLRVTLATHTDGTPPGPTNRKTGPQHGDHETGQPNQPRRPQSPTDVSHGSPEHGPGAIAELHRALDNLDDLVTFYKEQGRSEDMEAALQRRVELALKLAEIQMLAQCDGPGAAIQEYYRYVNRPERAVEFEIGVTDREIDRIKQTLAELDAGMAKLVNRRAALEQRATALSGHRDHLTGKLREVYSWGGNQGAGEMELAASQIPDEMLLMLVEMGEIEQALSNKQNLPVEEWTRLQQRRNDVTTRLRSLNEEHARLTAQIEQRRQESNRQYDEQRERLLSQLREKFPVNKAESDRFGFDPNPARRWIDGLGDFSRRFEALRARLGNKGPTTARRTAQDVTLRHAPADRSMIKEDPVRREQRLAARRQFEFKKRALAIKRRDLAEQEQNLARQASNKDETPPIAQGEGNE